jgi:NADPH:quinone reductase-like Zn-dependent oxidoreductase
MKAIVVHEYGPTNVLKLEEIPIPVPAASAGPWDALVRTGRSGVPQTLPLTPGSDICGSIHIRAPGVTEFSDGEDVYGATNPSFTIARKPGKIVLRV